MILYQWVSCSQYTICNPMVSAFNIDLLNEHMIFQSSSTHTPYC